MPIPFRSLWPIFAGLLILASPSTRAEETDCTFDRMQEAPDSVIEPCSKLIADKSIADDAKAQALFVRGRGYARTNRVSLAAQDFDLALKFAPSRSDIYVSRASAETKLGRFDESWADLNRALTINPRD